jgi:transcriptional/translational regulatory protein YebC/TACO1
LKEDELEKVNLAIEKIEENDDVQNVWSNIE